MRFTSNGEVREKLVSSLGLNPVIYELGSTEVLAALVRRAAGFVCPCTYQELLRSTLEPLNALVEQEDSLIEHLDAVIEQLISYGDLVEQAQAIDGDQSKSRALIYVTPPSFIMRSSGSAMLLGIAPERRSVLPANLEAKVEYHGHARVLLAQAEEGLEVTLAGLGLILVKPHTAFGAPPPTTPLSHLDHANQVLNMAPRVNELPSFVYLESSRDVRFYRGRWVRNGKASGRFVGRRPRAFGSDLWSYIELLDGQPQRLIDFPLPHSKGKACDEAWRLQAAIDANRGVPQVFRSRPTSSERTSLDFFSPIPSWAQRRWDFLGAPCSCKGTLISYSFPTNEVEEEFRFARDVLWLSRITG